LQADPGIIPRAQHVVAPVMAKWLTLAKQPDKAFHPAENSDQAVTGNMIPIVHTGSL
jgi:hypothetical protein